MDIERAGVVFAANYLIAASVAVFALNWNSRQWLRALGAAILGLVVAVGIAAVLGVIAYEPRPFVAQHFTPLIAHAADSSFPSDHLSALGAITAAGWLSRRSAGVFAAGVSALVGGARVAAGVHYPIDVVAGFLLGVACAVMFWRLLGTINTPLTRAEAWLSSRHLRPSATATT